MAEGGAGAGSGAGASAVAPSAALSASVPSYESVTVHPLVLLSAVDHHYRTVKDLAKRRVVGVILGEASFRETRRSIAASMMGCSQDPLHADAGCAQAWRLLNSGWLCQHSTASCCQLLTITSHYTMRQALACAAPLVDAAGALQSSQWRAACSVQSWARCWRGGCCSHMARLVRSVLRACVGGAAEG